MKPFIRKPFKGFVAYEWQVGGLVMQFIHSWSQRPFAGRSGFHIIRKPFFFRYWRISLWWDPFWKGFSLPEDSM